MAEKKTYTLLVSRQRIGVSREVYKAYYIAYEQERYARKRARELERSLERFSEDGINIEYQYAISQPSLEDQFLHEQMMEKMAAALDTLSESERILIDELFFNGKSERQLAVQIGIPRMTLCSRKKKILGKLKKYLEI